MKWAVAAVCAASCLGLLFIAGRAKADGVKWTGCYVGAGAGYAASTTKASLQEYDWGDEVWRTAGSLDGLGANGPALAGIVGCDLQINQFVVGLFGDYTKHFDHDVTLSIGPDSISAGFDTQWSLGGRAGVVIKNALLYGLVAYTSADTSFPKGVPSPTFTGYQVGGGIEVPLGSNFFGGIEYRYTMFDSEFIGDECERLELDPTMHTVMARLSYKFGSDALGK